MTAVKGTQQAWLLHRLRRALTARDLGIRASRKQLAVAGLGCERHPGLVITDRGAYRPGETVHFKAIFQERQPSGRLRPLSSIPLTVTVLVLGGNPGRRRG